MNKGKWLTGGGAAILGVVAGVIGGVAVLSRPVTVEIVGATVLIGWLGLLVVYLGWAVLRYNVNYGLSDHEWKVLHPELYAGKKELQRYQQLHEQWAERRRKGGGVPGPEELTAPTGNPYAGESFGLPPGVVRGMLALTALVMFLVIEVINVFRPDTEKRFDQLITAFMMVLAFYFGSRAVGALQSQPGDRTGKEESREEKGLEAPAGGPAPASETAPRPQLVPAVAASPETPSEQPAMPVHIQGLRLASLVTPAAPAASPAAGGRLSGLKLEARVLALTASFETGKGFPECFGVVTGDFDQMGLSFGALQWNLATGSLQPLWRRMRDEHEDLLRRILGSRFDEFRRMLDAPKAEQLQWARQLQRTTVRNNHTRWDFVSPWRQLLGELGASDEMIALQIEAASNRYAVALEACREWQLTTQRGVALMFDINVQNGKVDKAGAGALIRADYAQLPADLADDQLQLARMQIVARRRSEVAAPQWRTDVLLRKMTIANGVGSVHGRVHDLAKEYELTLAAVPELTSAPVQRNVA